MELPAPTEWGLACVLSDLVRKVLSASITEIPAGPTNFITGLRFSNQFLLFHSRKMNLNYCKTRGIRYCHSMLIAHSASLLVLTRRTHPYASRVVQFDSESAFTCLTLHAFLGLHRAEIVQKYHAFVGHHRAEMVNFLPSWDFTELR